MKFYPTRWLAAMLLGMIALSAHAFTLMDTDGKTHKLADYKGKWVLVNFWATWCPPCLDEIPDLVALSENKKNNVVVIGVALDYRNAKQVIDFAQSMQVSYPIVLGSDKIVSEVGPVEGLPTTYLYNPAGKLVAHQLGGITKEAVEAYIRRVAHGDGK
ncbi:MAG: TlpA family protein disulfide reductase [Thiobacillaceae bacterium]